MSTNNNFSQGEVIYDINKLSSKPYFITFEGCEGSGKSTQSKILYERLKASNIDVIHTREIGGTPEAEKIRDIVVNLKLFTYSELLLVMAARYEHVNNTILPALADGKWVICDRFIDSTAAYQSYESGISMEQIYKLHTDLIKIDNTKNDIVNKLRNFNINIQYGILPDITFLLNTTFKTGLTRTISRGDTNKFEEKEDKFHDGIYNNFMHIADIFSDRVVVIESNNLEIEDINVKIWNKTMEKLCNVTQ